MEEEGRVLSMAGLATIQEGMEKIDKNKHSTNILF
jgi:hypothetical protein